MKIRYWVQSETNGRFAIQGRFQTQTNGIDDSSPGCKLYSPPTYGPVADFFCRFYNWRVVLLDGRVQTVFHCLNATELELPPGTVSFSYQVGLEALDSGAESLYRGHFNEQFLYFLGLALFPAAEGIDEYEIEFGQITYSARQGQGRCFQCADRRQLFLTVYVQGAFELQCLSRPNLFLVQPRVLVDRTADWSGNVPLLLSECEDWFAVQAPFRKLTLFVWEGFGSSCGAGLSLDGCCCLELSDTDKLSSTYWLLLHELLHQWIGLSIRGKEPGLGWFFEGFVLYLTNLLLIRCGLDNPEIMSEAVRRLTETSDDCEGATNDYRDGFLLCHYFVEAVGLKNPDGFRQWWARFLHTWAAQAIGREELVGALLLDGPQADWELRLNSYLTGGTVTSPMAESVIDVLYGKISQNQFADKG